MQKDENSCENTDQNVGTIIKGWHLETFIL